jgi:hypothetical protein
VICDEADEDTREISFGIDATLFSLQVSMSEARIAQCTPAQQAPPAASALPHHQRS